MNNEIKIITGVVERDSAQLKMENPKSPETPVEIPFNSIIDEIRSLIDYNQDKDLLILPGGTFYFEKYEPEEIIFSLESNLSNYLKEINSDLTLAFGFDCEKDMNENIPIHQMGVALNSEGILALARKFHPTNKIENSLLIKADHYLSSELEYPRIFPVKGHKFYLTVCYDCYGPAHKNLKNPGVDSAIVLIHNFSKGSGYVDFARKGFAGLSKIWNVPVFGTARFWNINIPPKWPTGLFNSAPEKSTLYFKYSDNSLAPVSEPLTLETKLGKVRLSEYHLKNKELEKRDD